jgi:UDP-glucose 4-epimerase
MATASKGGVFSFIDDCLYCLKEMAFRPNVVGEVINVGPDEETITIIELAEKIANQLKFNLNPIFMPGRPQEVEHATCSSDKARKLLQYNTTVDLDTGLARMIEAIRKKGVRDFKYHLDLEIINEKTPKTWRDRVF